MEKETQKPLTPPRIRNIDKVLEELRRGPKYPTIPKVYLTKEEYFPSKAMKKVENIATLMDVIRDEDFLARCQNARKSFYISSKDIPLELINALKSLEPEYQLVSFRIDCEKGTLKLISEEELDILNPSERGVILLGVLEGIRKGELLSMGYTDYKLGIKGWSVLNLPFSGDGDSPLPVAFTEPTD